MNEGIKQQVHTKFKVFTGNLADDNSIGTLASDIETFVRDSKVAAKSIGIEYLEGVGKLMMTLGYNVDQPAYSVKLHCVNIGKFEQSPDFGKLEDLMQEAAAKQRNIICHELYVTDAQEVFMVFMTEEE